MIIICDKCNTKFNIKDSIIPDEGADFKCTKCSNLLHLKKEVKVDIIKKEIEVKKEEPKKVDDLDYGALFGDDTKEEVKKDESFDDLFGNNFAKFEEQPTIVAPTEEVDYDSLKDVADELDLGVETPISSNVASSIDDLESSFSESPNFLSKNAEDGPSFDDVFGGNDLANDFLDEDEKTQIAPYQDEDIKAFVKKANEESENKVKKFKEELKTSLEDENFDKKPEDWKPEDSSSFKHITIKDEKDVTYEFKEENDLLEWIKTRKDLNTLLYSHDNKNFESITNFSPVKNLVDEFNAKLNAEEAVSVDEISFKSPVLSQELEKVEEQKEEEEKKGGFGKFLLILIVLLLIAAGTLYVLHTQKIVNIPFLPPVEATEKVDNTNKDTKVDANKDTKVDANKDTKVDEKKDDAKVDDTKVDEKKDDTKVDEKKDDAIKVENKKDAKVDEKKDTKVDEKKDDATKVAEKKDAKKDDATKVAENKDTKVENKKATKVAENKDTKVEKKDDATKVTEKKNAKVEKKETRKEKRKRYRTAKKLFDTKKFEEAKVAYLKLAMDYPEDAEPYGVLYVIFKNLGDKTTAYKFRKAYKQLSNEQKNIVVSADLLKKLLNPVEAPKTMQERYTLARRKLAIKDYKTAKVNFLNLAIENPKDSEAYGALSIIYKALGDPDTSAKFYQASTDIDNKKPNTTISITYLKELLKK